MFKSRVFEFFVGVTLVSCLSFAGCGSAAEEDGFKGDRGTVTGKITLDGKPVPAGCNVLFVSTTGGYSATGVTNAEGVYSLSYNGSAKLPAVVYRVQLAPPARTASNTPPDPNQKQEAASALPYPEKFTSTSTSGLEFPVKTGANTADFALTP